jgi:hypothetical protein
MTEQPQNVTLKDRRGQVFATVDGGDPVPVRVVWARPLSGRGRCVSLLTEDKQEVAMVRRLEELDEASRAVAEDALAERYLMCRITRVHSTDPHFGNRYFDVETDRGAVKFILKDPNRNVTWLSEDRLILRDTQGNRYEIAALSELDAKSRAEVQKVV